MDKKKTKKDDGPVQKKSRVIFELPIPTIAEKNGILLVCGQGDMGQLGLGDENERKRPVLVNGVQNVVDIRAGGMHSLCLTKNGEIYSFGCNDEGALGRDTTTEGSESTPGIVTLPGKCVQISAGDSHSACLLEDGRVYAWGSFRDSHGNMGLTMEGNKRLPVEVLPGTRSCEIASGADHLIILTCFGKVYTMGCAEQGQLGRVAKRSMSGESRRGKTELLSPGLVIIRGVNRVDKIWATIYCSFAREAGKHHIYAFGLNNYRQLGMTSTSELVTIPTLTKFENVKKIAGGQHHTLILTEDNKCFAIGRHNYGRLGLGEVKDDVIEPVPITALDGKNILDLACGEVQSFAITDDGKVYAWGMGSNLQLGTGSEDDELVPVLINSKQIQDRNVIRVSSGGQHSMFLIESEENDEVIIKKAAPKAAISTNKKETELSKDDDIKEDKSDLNKNQKAKLNGNDVIKMDAADAGDTNAINNEISNKKENTLPAKKGRKRKQ